MGAAGHLAKPPLANPLFAGSIPARPTSSYVLLRLILDTPRHEGGQRGWVGERIRSIRIAKGRTQEELALTSGVTCNLLIDIEHGRRGLLYECPYDISQALHVPSGDLLG